MAATVAMISLLGRLWFTPLASDVLVNQQGINQLYELELLTDKEVNQLAKLLRNPGGNEENPDADAADQPPTGHIVPMLAVRNCKLAVFFVRHTKRTMRTILPGHVTITRIR